MVYAAATSPDGRFTVTPTTGTTYTLTATGPGGTVGQQPRGHRHGLVYRG